MIPFMAIAMIVTLIGITAVSHSQKRAEEQRFEKSKKPCDVDELCEKEKVVK